MPTEDGRATLLLLRHGETAWNRERRIMGDLDVPLNDEGRRQCEAAGRFLAGFGVSRILASPLARTRESAAILAAVLNVPRSEDGRLVEVRFGEWQGRTYDDVSRDPRYRAFAADPHGAATPAGETAAGVQARALEALASVSPGECVLVVTHGDLIRTLLCHYLGAPLAAWRRIRTDNGGISAVATGEGACEVKFLNALSDPARARDASHWGGHP